MDRSFSDCKSFQKKKKDGFFSNSVFVYCYYSQNTKCKLLHTKIDDNHEKGSQCSSTRLGFIPPCPALSFKAGRSPTKKSVWYISVNAPYPSPALLNPSVNKFYPQLNKLETFQFHLQVGNTVEYWFYVLLSNSVKSTAKLSWIEFAVLATNPACQPFDNYNQGCLIKYWKQLQGL